jgi:hypothetical protein
VKQRETTCLDPTKGLLPERARRALPPVLQRTGNGSNSSNGKWLQWSDGRAGAHRLGLRELLLGDRERARALVPLPARRGELRKKRRGGVSAACVRQEELRTKRPVGGAAEAAHERWSHSEAAGVGAIQTARVGAIQTARAEGDRRSCGFLGSFGVDAPEIGLPEAPHSPTLQVDAASGRRKWTLQVDAANSARGCGQGRQAQRGQRARSGAARGRGDL